MRLGLALAIAATAAGTAPAALTAQEPTFPARATGVSSMALRQLFADYWRWHLADEPEDATRVGVHSFDDRWRDWSKRGRAAARERRQEFLRNFQYAGLGNLTNPERLSVTLVQQRLVSELATETLRLLARLSPDGGAHQEVFRVLGAMPAGSVADYERQIARLRSLPAYAQQHIELWEEQLAGSVAQPASVVHRVVAEIETQRGTAAERSPLLAAFRSFPASVPADERARLEQAARTAYHEQFVPTWERLERFLRDTYRPRSRDSLAIGGLAAGRDHYADLLAFYGAPSVSVDALHEQAMTESALTEPRATPGRASDRLESTIAVPEFQRHLQLPAFEEGWKAYAAGLTRDAAVRAALDSGIHARGWSRMQALVFATTHIGADRADVVVDAVTATPGRALAVFAGAQKFATLRRAAEARLGTRFDEREFDRTVLGGGDLTLDLVELQVEEFLKARPGR